MLGTLLWLTPSYRQSYAQVKRKSANHVSENAYFFRGFTISTRRRRLLSVSCLPMVLNNFRKRRNGARRRGECLRPLARIAVEPHRLHAAPRRSHDIRQRIIADVQHLRRLDARQLQELRKNARIRLGRARGT